MPLAVWRTEMVGERTDERVVLREKVSKGGPDEMGVTGAIVA